MLGFNTVYNNLTHGENPVRCPFHADTKESASVKITDEGDNNLFNCLVCGGMNETQFVSRYYGMSYKDAMMAMNKKTVSNQTLTS
jgi:DNA primase